MLLKARVPGGLMRRGFALWAFIALASAGCVNSDEPDPDVEDSDALGGVSTSAANSATATAPEWQVGDWWRFEGAAEGTWSWTAVVTGLAGGYLIGTDNADAAFYNEREPISFLGPQRSSDLAGSGVSGPVQWFAFPLEDGKTWPLTLDGVTSEVTATRLKDGSFAMEAVADGVTQLRYSYEPAARWFGHLEFFAQGEPLHVIHLADYGGNYTGELATVEFAMLDEGNFEGPTPSATTYTMPTGATDIWLEASIACEAQGNVLFAIGPAEGAPNIATSADDSDGYSAQAQCPAAIEVSGVIAEAPFEGTWGHAYQSTSQDAHVEYAAYVRTITWSKLGA